MYGSLPSPGVKYKCMSKWMLTLVSEHWLECATETYIKQTMFSKEC